MSSPSVASCACMGAIVSLPRLNACRSHRSHSREQSSAAQRAAPQPPQRPRPGPRRQHRTGSAAGRRPARARGRAPRDARPRAGRPAPPRPQCARRWACAPYHCWWLPAGGRVSCIGAGCNARPDASGRDALSIDAIHGLCWFRIPRRALSKSIPACHVRIKHAYEAPVPRGRRAHPDRPAVAARRGGALLLAELGRAAGAQPELRQWFNRDPRCGTSFAAATQPSSPPEAWAPLASAPRHGVVTLVYSAHDQAVNDAVALRDFCCSPAGWMRAMTATGGTR